MSVFKAYIEKDFRRDDVRLFIRLDERGSGRRSMVSGLIMSTLDHGAEIPDAGRLIASEYGRQNEFVQAILDAAWAYGFRPSGEAGSDSSMARHLEDMRAIAFHKIGAPKP